MGLIHFIENIFVEKFYKKEKSFYRKIYIVPIKFKNSLKK